VLEATRLFQNFNFELSNENGEIFSASQSFLAKNDVYSIAPSLLVFLPYSENLNQITTTPLNLNSQNKTSYNPHETEFAVAAHLYPYIANPLLPFFFQKFLDNLKINTLFYLK
jgi:hypothetical protein